MGFESLQMWTVRVKLSAKENKIEGDGYCGYVALDLLRNYPKMSSIREAEGRK